MQMGGTGRWMGRSLVWIALAVAALGVLLPNAAYASCAGMAGVSPLFLRTATGAGSAIPSGHLRITFVGHSTFEVESPAGARVATDFNGFIAPQRLPHIVTMNNAHDSHYSAFVDKGIRHVLRGWDPGGGIARHNIAFRDIRVRNVPTNLRKFGDKWSNGNSMFVIEGAGLCVAHISHLHHVLSGDHVRELGLIDVAFAPIDGMWTMSHQELFEVLGQIKPRLVIPMHYGSMGGVEAFIAQAKPKYEIRDHDSNSIMVSLRTLPKRTEILFLRGH